MKVVQSVAFASLFFRGELSHYTIKLLPRARQELPAVICSEVEHPSVSIRAAAPRGVAEETKVHVLQAFRCKQWPLQCPISYLFIPLQDIMLENSNPLVHTKKGAREFTPQEMDDHVIDLEPVDAREVFDLIRDIRDPEHPLSLEELSVVNEEDIDVDNEKSTVLVKFTPTINHCSLATLIGLAIQVKLLRCLPSRFKIDVRIAEGTHATEDAVNKQLGDKERVAAALENPNLLEAVNECIAES